MAASDEAELMHMVATAAAHDEGPIAFRYPRGAGTGATLPERGAVLEIGKGRVLCEGTDVAILSYGAHLAECTSAAATLELAGLSVTLADARFAKPLDEELVLQLARHHRALITVEEGAMCGFGAIVLQRLAQAGALDRGLAVRTMHLPDRYIDQASPDEMYEAAGMTAQHIVDMVKSAAGSTAEVVPLGLVK